MAASDKLLGGMMMLVAAFVCSYYTMWAMVLPFVPNSSPLHDFFPPREWAIRLPAFIFVVGVGSIGSFIGMTIRAENEKKAQKARQRVA